MKNHSSNSENCWEALRAHFTTTYLEMKNVTVKEINEIGQSAAELLNSGTALVFENCVLLHEEGSETMHGTPKAEQAKVKI